MKSVILRAPLLTQSGYGVHARQIARWLFDLADSRGDIEVVTEPLRWGDTPWLTDPDSHGGLIGRIIQHSIQKPKYDVSLQLQLPNEWNPFLADFNVGLTAAVEADRCNPEWINACNRMDLIIAPSEFVKGVLTGDGKVLKKEIKVVPESFVDAILREDIKPFPLTEATTDFNFLVFGQITGNNPENDRKNLFYTCKWLAEQFKDSPNVGVVIKTNMGRNTTIDRLKTQQVLSQLLTEVQKTSSPRFYLLHGDMTDEEVAGLYRNPTLKAMVALTRGEGFGLPILEAAASGLPVIASGWSAHTEFLGRGKYIKVDTTLAPVHESRIDGQIFQQGFQWGRVSEDDAKRKLKKFVESPSLPTVWAKDLSKILKKEYSFEAIAKHYTEALKGII